MTTEPKTGRRAWPRRELRRLVSRLVCLAVGHAAQRDDEISAPICPHCQKPTEVVYHCPRCQRPIERLAWDDAPPWVQADLLEAANG